MFAGLSTTGEMLIFARVLQGVGGAMILPSTQSILNTNFRGRDRAIAFGIWGSVIGGMAALGPLLGGWLTTNLSWRWAFYINLPIGLIAIIGTLVYIRESRDEHAGTASTCRGSCSSPPAWRPSCSPSSKGARTAGRAERAVHGHGLDVAVHVDLDHPGRPRLRFRRARGLRRVRGEPRPERQILPVRRRPVAVPRLPLRQPRRYDRVARRVRPALRPATLPPGGPRH